MGDFNKVALNSGVLILSAASPTAVNGFSKASFNLSS